MKKAIILSYLLLGLVAVSSAQTTGTVSINSLPASAGWYAIPNSQLQTVCPPNNFGGSSYSFADQCKAVVYAWNSAVMDTSRNKLIVWGGGHHDYSGNELYAFDLNALTVQRLTDPGLPLATDSNCSDSLVNGTQPNSRHTYDGLAYLVNADRLFAVGGAFAPCGYFSNSTWTFDFKTNTWHAMNPSGPLPSSGPGDVTAYDPNTGKVFLHDDHNLYSYDYGANKYQLLDSNTTIDYHLTGVIDPKRKKFVMMGGGQAFVFDISPTSSYAGQALNSSGGSAIINSDYPGLVYDPVSDRIVAWNGGNTIYYLNLDTLAWTSATYSGGPGAAQQDGTYKRWNYSPASGVFVLVNDMGQNAYVLRTSPSTADTTPPAAPTHLRIR